MRLLLIFELSFITSVVKVNAFSMDIQRKSMKKSNLSMLNNN